MDKKIISYKEYKTYVSKICHDITLSNWKPDFIVGITRGGLLPAVMISQYFKVPCHTLNVSLRDHAYCESNTWMSHDAYYDKNILIVDDINDSGATLNWIVDDFQSSTCHTDKKWNTIWNGNVKFAVVADNLGSNFEHKIDFCGFELNKEENNVWVSFPYEEWWEKEE